MQFRKQHAIYLQIGEHLCDAIANGKWMPAEKIPSVREMAIRVEVNPNTVMRTYSDLEQKGIIYNRRGIGFFVADDAAEKILDLKRNDFIQKELPRIFKIMDLLGMSVNDLKVLSKQYHTEEEVNENK